MAVYYYFKLNPKHSFLLQNHNIFCYFVITFLCTSPPGEVGFGMMVGYKLSTTHLKYIIYSFC